MRKSYLIGLSLACLGWVAVRGETTVHVVDEILTITRPEEVASGSSRHTPFFAVGGIPGLGLFAGQPNPLQRNDRVLLRFDLATYPARISRLPAVDRAWLRIHIGAVVSPGEAERSVEISYSRTEPGPFTEFDLVRSDFVEIEIVEVSSASAEHWFEIEVTEAVNRALLLGHVGVGFRIRDKTAEAAGNPNLEAAGILVAFPGEKAPQLRMQFIPGSILPPAETRAPVETP